MQRTFPCNPSWPTIAGYFGAGILCLVSLVANLRYGLSLARDPLDKSAYAGASIAVDILKAALPLLALTLWRRRHHVMAMASAVLWLGCLSWSLSSAVGFSLATRAEANAERATEKTLHAGWATTISRAEGQLSALGAPRAAAVVKAELASPGVPAPIWARTKGCTDTTLLESQTACAAVVSLRRELAVAEVAERLEKTLATGHAHLATTAGAPPEVDPQAAALARLTGVDDSSVRTGLALLLAGIVEVGSALGFSIVALATRDRTPSPTGQVPVLSHKSLARDSGSSTTGGKAAKPCDQVVGRVPTRSRPNDRKPRQPNDRGLHESVRDFLRARTIKAEGSVVGSTTLHEAFGEYCRARGLGERSHQALGRELKRLGYMKERSSRSGRVRYLGIQLVDQVKPSTNVRPSLAAAGMAAPKVQPGPAPHLVNGFSGLKVRSEGSDSPARTAGMK